MAECLRILAGVLAITSAGSLFAAPEPPPPPPSGAPHGSPAGKKDRPDNGDDWKSHPKFKERLEKMSPEERKHFEENWKRWREMGEHERKEWQRRAAEARERMEKAIDETLARLELTLDKDRREVFALRYRQERKKIEEQLCKEMGERRQEMIDGMLQQLKTEFSGDSKQPEAPASTESPTSQSEN